MDMRKQPEPQIAVPFAGRCSPSLSERHNLPPLRDRFRVEVASGVDASEEMSARSRALAVWVFERWREDRKAGLTGEGLLKSCELLIKNSRDELN